MLGARWLPPGGGLSAPSRYVNAPAALSLHAGGARRTRLLPPLRSARSAGVSSRREQLRLDVLERLELQGISGRIEEEQRGLLSRLALEADVRLDHEFDLMLLEPVGQRPPLIHFQHHTAVRNRHA